ncbi:3-ketosteroid-9-alpha-hydroxylase oxygenase subunit [Paeniglutamicibacter gangotriensis Lz1y]|uniref:3-ketosteroid-9-alpha-hydroxylase oxygenase subunit n=2 Tax=Paeniglutamicibacter gangotriensis TaxID=254787 RepID=M7NEH7_9MICC|nr:3-ketosteroid-9-alpha-hydroxylase oxygenase subunit [Paeniglutamicibacter gangotriensis Lz1y]
MHMVRVNPEQTDRYTPQASPARFARGWHCLGMSRRFNTAGAHSLQAFGRRVQVQSYPDVSPRVLLDEPGHQRELPAFEQDGLLFAWHDPQENPPPAHLSIPRITGHDAANCAEGPGWSNWSWKETILTAQTGQVVEHLVRLANSTHVTAGDPLYFKNVFEGHRATQYFEGPLHHSYQLQEPAPQGAKILLANSVASYFGPAVMISQLDYVLEDRSLDAVVLTAHYPIDEQHLVLMTGVMVRTEQPPDPELKAVAAGHSTQILRSITNAVHSRLQRSQDEDSGKIPGADSPVAALRRWYGQFFVDAYDVDSGMTDRFEYEVDTTMPMDLWTRSSARNLILRRVNGKQLA